MSWMGNINVMNIMRKGGGGGGWHVERGIVFFFSYYDADEILSEL